ncbi:glycine--tRNA ligase, chloroplastic/mitochondrial 2-like isoform X1 [Zingiber officinale]|uniref:glycine--tRNA ligase, chloroplastic/mitochondrial 2-like isoform X1 n=1 Tax=Zingiber officinale TaxID=94328 RepID=UPI001C4BAC6C|nr:glycine--tRNA ligase, chloroplastic/mitochondrial 2-like isoform X1 [Zingiber officinale]
MVLLALSFSAPPLAVGVRSYRPRLRAWKRGRDHDRSRKFSFCSRLIPSLPRTNDFAAILLSSAPRSQSESHRSLVESPVVTFQQAIQRLQDYWASVGCAIMQCSNTEVGAGTMNPSTFLRVLGPEPWNVAYVEPSVRPDDSRYGDNPNRLQRHTQFQVILKPDPGNSQELFIRSLLALGIDVDKHDIRFVEDNWESPVLGAWGLGWEIWMDGMEITQFTYFQQAGSLPLLPISVEITYGLERILMLLQGVNHFKKIQYADGITYGELFLENEREMSAYYLEHANISHIQQCFENFEDEALSLLALELPIPAYDQLLKASHAFNILDARGFVGVTERARYFARMRSLARQCAQLWLKTREALGHPLGFSKENDLLFQNLPNSQLQKVLERPGAFVLEIGTEEMPPHDVVEASNQLRSLTVEYLKKRRLSCGEVSSYGTPRRLVVFTESLSHMQAENEIEVRGPPAARAFDSEGTPTQAAKGFCRKNGITLDDLYKKFEGKTEYVYARIKESKQSTFEVLVDGLPSILALISFPKSMRWNSQVLFSRPIRWILALHGETVLPFSFGGVSSGRQTCGLRSSHSAILEIETAEAYLHKMREAGILVNMKERKEKIICDADSLASSVNSNAIMQDSLVEEVVNLVEAPLAILGRFDEYFLEIPKDILIMVMQKHQKYFPLICQHTGTLMPYFIAVANGLIDEQVVRKGNEAVLRARYEDASFFYKMDTQKKFSEFRGLLSGILFHEQLGTMLDKVVRIQKIVGKLSHSLGNEKSVHTIVEDAAALAMSDLATSIVTEFTSLSGIMARHYALRDGYPEQIAEALFEITLPRFSGDILPKSDAGIVLAIADR